MSRKSRREERRIDPVETRPDHMVEHQQGPPIEMRPLEAEVLYPCPCCYETQGGQGYDHTPKKRKGNIIICPPPRIAYLRCPKCGTQWKAPYNTKPVIRAVMPDIHGSD